MLKIDKDAEASKAGMNHWYLFPELADPDFESRLNEEIAALNISDNLTNPAFSSLFSDFANCPPPLVEKAIIDRLGRKGTRCINPNQGVPELAGVKGKSGADIAPLEGGVLDPSSNEAAMKRLGLEPASEASVKSRFLKDSKIPKPILRAIGDWQTGGAASDEVASEVINNESSRLLSASWGTIIEGSPDRFYADEELGKPQTTAYLDQRKEFISKKLSTERQAKYLPMGQEGPYTPGPDEEVIIPLEEAVKREKALNPGLSDDAALNSARKRIEKEASLLYPKPPSTKRINQAKLDKAVANLKPAMEAEQKLWSGLVNENGTIRLYRGVDVAEGSMPELGAGHVADYPATSWTVYPEVAGTYGGVVMARDVKPTEILASFLGTLPTADEGEVVVYTPADGAEVSVIRRKAGVSKNQEPELTKTMPTIDLKPQLNWLKIVRLFKPNKPTTVAPPSPSYSLDAHVLSVL